MVGNRGIRGNWLHDKANYIGFLNVGVLNLQSKNMSLSKEAERTGFQKVADMTLRVHRSQPNMVGWTYLDLHVPQIHASSSREFFPSLLPQRPQWCSTLRHFSKPSVVDCGLSVSPMNSARSQMSKSPEMNFVFRAVGKHPQHSPHSLGCLLHVPSQT